MKRKYSQDCINLNDCSDFIVDDNLVTGKDTKDDCKTEGRDEKNRIED